MVTIPAAASRNPEIPATSRRSSPCRYSSSMQVIHHAIVSSPQRCSITILYGPQARATRNFHRRWRWSCRGLRSRAEASEKTGVAIGLQGVTHRSNLHPFAEPLLPVAASNGASATLKLLASVGCASLARSRVLEKRGRTTISVPVPGAP